MNLVSSLQNLDKLILARAPISEQRAILNSMIEQCEAHDAQSEEHSELKIAHTKLQEEHAKLKRPTTPKKFKFINDQPDANYGVKG